ncbi:MAG: septum formation initiator family protein [Rhodospirillaceae bacterium]
MGSGLNQFKLKILQVLGPTLGILACAYFSYHAVHGDRGLTSLISLKEDVAEARAQADDLARRRGEWEHKVSLISAKSLDLDMLEERARIMLNVGFEQDHVILWKALGRGAS